MREIKFRAWDEKRGHWVIPTIHHSGQNLNELLNSIEDDGLQLVQYTGLKDKNGDKEVYECDIIDSEGNIIGNQYETPALHEDKANLLIQGFGTKNWFTTYKEAVDRGCHDA